MPGRREILFTVLTHEAGERLDTYLCRRLRGLSREQVQRLILEGVRVVAAGAPAGRRLKAATLVRAGLQFAISHEAPVEDPLPHIPIVHEDDSLLVVDKPAGLAVHPAGRHHLCTLTRALAARAGVRADPAHRLDRETSGLLVCGRGSVATSILKRAFAAGEVHKTYLAISAGEALEEDFEVDLPLELGTGLVRVRMAVGAGKASHTAVRVQARFRDARGLRYALLACSPRTGRQHQIRAHLAAVGLPIVGDKIYGPDETIFIRFTEHALTTADRARLQLPRHALHAAELRFAHPGSGEPCLFRSSLPADLAAFLAGLERIA